MSGRNAEIAREVGRRFEAQDFEGLRPLFHPDAVLWAPEGWPEQGPWKGHDAIIRQFERLAEDYTAQRTAVDEIIESGDRTVGKLRWRMRGRRSGIDSQLEVWFANRMRGDRIVEVRYCWSRDDALESAGLKG
jgi:ketosteroid isomerase-like protein